MASPTHPDESVWYSNNDPSFTWTSFGLQLAGSYNTPGTAYDTALSGSYAYVADSGSGLRVIDISNPAAPSPVGFYDTPGSASGVAALDNYAYVADGSSGLRIIDISNPAAPSLAGFVDTPGNAWDVAISGSYAYVADYLSGLRVIDISDPGVPVEVGFYDTTGNAYGVAVAGNYAYVADYTAGLRVIDVSNPAAPTLKGTYNTSGYAYGVAVAGSYAYVADGSSGLQVINVSNPSAPALSGTLDTPGTARGVAVAGSEGYAYVADSGSGLQVVDVSNPAAPALKGTYDTPGSAIGLTLSGEYAYVADGSSGLNIIKLVGAAGYSYILDQTAITEPDTVEDGTAGTASFSDLADGEWYFHVRAVDGSGNWGPAAHRRVRIATCGEGKPSLSLSRLSAYWASYADYTNRTLSVNYRITNGGTYGAFGAQIVGTANSGGVTSTNTPMAVGDIAVGGSATKTVTYHVPVGVGSFTSTVYATAQNSCSESFSYPGPYAES